MSRFICYFIFVLLSMTNNLTKGISLFTKKNEVCKYTLNTAHKFMCVGSHMCHSCFVV